MDHSDKYNFVFVTGSYVAHTGLDTLKHDLEFLISLVLDPKCWD